MGQPKQKRTENKRMWKKYRGYCMMAVFYQEKEICKLFKSENGGLDINFSISSNEVRHNRNWDYQKGKLILNALSENFKLPVIGWGN